MLTMYVLFTNKESFDAVAAKVDEILDNFNTTAEFKVSWRKLTEVDAFVIRGEATEISFLNSRDTSPFVSLDGSHLHDLRYYFENDIDTPRDPNRCKKCSRLSPNTIEEENDYYLDPRNSQTAVLNYPISGPESKGSETNKWYLRAVGKCYELAEDSVEWEDSVFCDACFEENLNNGVIVLNQDVNRCCNCLQFHDRVTCELCNSKFDCVGLDPTQGDTCASSIRYVIDRNEWWLFSGYGSVYDYPQGGRKFLEYPEDKYRRQDGVGIDPICDSCVGELIASGKVSDLIDLCCYGA